MFGILFPPALKAMALDAFALVKGCWIIHGFRDEMYISHFTRLSSWPSFSDELFWTSDSVFGHMYSQGCEETVLHLFRWVQGVWPCDHEKISCFWLNCYVNALNRSYQPPAILHRFWLVHLFGLSDLIFTPNDEEQTFFFFFFKVDYLMSYCFAYINPDLLHIVDI